MTDDAAAFIAERLPLAEVPGCAPIRLHRAGPASGVWRLAGEGGASPYWAWPWGGGLALAQHLLAHPEAVAGRRVLDYGAGGGLVAIAAALGGAAHVTAADIDANAIAAIGLNAAANGVGVEPLLADLAEPPAGVDLVLAGDVFYDAQVAARSAAFLERCRAAGMAVLVGDIGRAFLPRRRLRALASYAVSDFGAPPGEIAAGVVYAFEETGPSPAQP